MTPARGWGEDGRRIGFFPRYRGTLSWDGCSSGAVTTWPTVPYAIGEEREGGNP